MPRLLPVLGLPLVADGVLMLAVKLRNRPAGPDGTGASTPDEEG